MRRSMLKTIDGKVKEFESGVERVVMESKELKKEVNDLAELIKKFEEDVDEFIRVTNVIRERREKKFPRSVNQIKEMEEENEKEKRFVKEYYRYNGRVPIGYNHILSDEQRKEIDEEEDEKGYQGAIAYRDYELKSSKEYTEEWKRTNIVPSRLTHVAPWEPRGDE